MAEPLAVTLCFSPAPRQVFECTLALPAGSRVRDALAQALLHPGWPADWTAAQMQALSPGLWGRKAEWSTLLRAGDRLEFYRPLQVDPKVARRQRFGQQGARRAGLFAKKRPGSAAGY